VHGHSLRLDEDGMMFDMLARRVLDKGTVKYVKNMIAEPLDKAVNVGKPMDDKWLKAHTTIYNSNGGTGFREDKEYVEFVQTVHSLRTKYGFMPKE
jgi:methyl-coenzyme M reductase gamma subunit